MIPTLPLPKDMEKSAVETGEKYLVEKAMVRPVRKKNNWIQESYFREQWKKKKK